MSKEENQVEFSDLVRRRSNIQGRLTKLYNYVQDMQNGDIGELSGIKIKELGRRLDIAQELFRQFDQLQTLIENICEDSATSEQIDIRDLIESKFIYVMSSIEELIEKHSSQKEKETFGDACSNKSSTCISHGLQSIKLPTIKLPTFNGSYLKWLEFRDTFQSLIHNNESIPGINKFHYLRSYHWRSGHWSLPLKITK